MFWTTAKLLFAPENELYQVAWSLLGKELVEWHKTVRGGSRQAGWESSSVG